MFFIPCCAKKKNKQTNKTKGKHQTCMYTAYLVCKANSAKRIGWSTNGITHTHTPPTPLLVFTDNRGPTNISPTTVDPHTQIFTIQTLTILTVNRLTVDLVLHLP